MWKYVISISPLFKVSVCVNLCPNRISFFQSPLVPADPFPGNEYCNLINLISIYFGLEDSISCIWERLIQPLCLGGSKSQASAHLRFCLRCSATFWGAVSISSLFEKAQYSRAYSNKMCIMSPEESLEKG